MIHAFRILCKYAGRFLKTLTRNVRLHICTAEIILHPRIHFAPDVSYRQIGQGVEDIEGKTKESLTD